MKRSLFKYLQVDLKHDESIGVAFVFWIQGPCCTVDMIDVVQVQQVHIHIYSLAQASSAFRRTLRTYLLMVQRQHFDIRVAFKDRLLMLPSR